MLMLKKILVYTACIYGVYVIYDYSDYFLLKNKFVAPENRGDLWTKRTCINLLENGTLTHNDAWKPKGCKLKKYNKFDARECFKKITEEYGQTYISFVGDSRMRTLLRSVIGLINESSPLAKHDKTHADIHYREKKAKIHMELVWEPFVEDSTVKRFKDWYDVEDQKRPLVVFVGIGNWFVRKYGFSLKYQKIMARKLMRVTTAIKKISDTTGVIWRLQDPVKYKLLNYFRRNLTNENLHAFNTLATEIFESEGIPVLSSMREIALTYNMSDYGDGLHACCKTARKDTQILMNYICNPFVALDRSICCGINSS